jgi:hypothetical protein
MVFSSIVMIDVGSLPGILVNEHDALHRYVYLSGFAVAQFRRGAAYNESDQGSVTRL